MTGADSQVSQSTIDHVFVEFYFDVSYLHRAGIASVFDSLQHPDTVDFVRRLTGIPDLEADPHLHGAGLHAYPRLVLASFDDMLLSAS